jgi:phosphatidylglycerol:prolipoprotein diacylglycerol transferase
MIPFLFPHTPFETPTYYVLYLLAFLGAILLATKRAERYGSSPVLAIDLGMVTFVSGVLGARLFFAIFSQPDYFLRNPFRIFYVWQGGFVLYGGILFGIIGGYLFLKSKGANVGRWADIVAPAVLLGIGIGRMGCLAAGCCYGAETDWSWGMVFTNLRSAAPLNIPLHPTQLLEAIFGFISCVIFSIIFRRPSKMNGSALLWALLIYSLFRFGIEFLRGDAIRGLYVDGKVSSSQLIAVATALICSFWLIYLFKKSKNVS